MANIIDRRSIDQTLLIYDTFYATSFTVDANKFDLVFSFFYETSKNKEIAGNFTVVLFRISEITNIDILTLLTQLKGVVQEKLAVTKQLAYYLNSFKSKTSLYGVTRLVLPNVPVARNVVL